jgi:hypothetical protein
MWRASQTAGDVFLVMPDLMHNVEHLGVCALALPWCHRRAW